MNLLGEEMGGGIGRKRGKENHNQDTICYYMRKELILNKRNKTENRKLKKEKTYPNQVNEMAQQVQVFTSKPGYLNSVPGTYMVE